MIDADILKAAARALNDCIEGYQAAAVVAAVTPLVRAQVLEEAAQVAENQPSAPLKIGAPQTWIKQQIAAHIRAIKEQP